MNEKRSKTISPGLPAWGPGTANFSRPLIMTVCLMLMALASCQRTSQRRALVVATPPPPVVRPLPNNASPQLQQLIEAAVEQSKVTTGYDPSYVGIGYPNGDVSSTT